MSDDAVPGTELAVIGMAGRFPGAGSPAQLWRKVCDGAELITFFPAGRLRAAGVPADLLADPAYVPATGVLAGIEDFDADYFGCSPREAVLTDPQQRILLECAAEALMDAGYDPARYPGRVGVYAGCGASSYLTNHLRRRPDLVTDADQFQVQLGNDRDFLATRIAYRLDLRGPAVSVATACSTSLVAVHLAGQGLLTGDADLALAGGVSVRTPQQRGYLHRPGGMMSPDGHCRPFDRRAAGTVGGSGAGMVVLKRLAEAVRDGDQIYAVLKASAVNNDGGGKAGFAAPSVDGQAEVIAEALAMAGVEPTTIGYVETHGTGTPLGDPIEVAALRQAFGPATGTGWCRLGSVKANLGHLDTAAGITGLITAVLAVRHGLLPPLRHFTAPNPEIDLATGPFRVSRELAPWPPGPGPRRAGVSSFGVGGTNAHVIIEQPPTPAPVPPGGPARAAQLLVLSAASPVALDTARQRLADHLAAHPELDLADVAYTLRVGRRILPHRAAVVTGVAGAAGRLADRSAGDTGLVRPDAPDLPVWFLFPGQGAQRPGMGGELYRTEPAFRQEVDLLAELFRPHLGVDLRPVLAGEAGELDLDQTWLTQPALFTVEYALARLWQSWGVHPAGLLGHSLGEWVAACLAGVFAVEDAVALVAARGRLAQQAPPGAMLAVQLADADARQLLEPGDGLSLAAVNAPGLTVLAGPADAVRRRGAELAGRGARCRALSVSRAFHSAAMDAAAAELSALAGTVRLRPPVIPFASNVTGTWIRPQDATDPAYWGRQARLPVLFSAGLATVAGTGPGVLLEVGPGRSLTALVRRHPEPVCGRPAVPSLPGGQPEDAALLAALGRLWTAGVPVDLLSIHSGENRRRVRLPGYPWQRRRYWIDGEPGAGEASATAGAAPQAAGTPSAVVADPPVAAGPARHPRPALRTAYRAPESPVQRAVAAVWEEHFAISPIGLDDDFFELGGDSLQAAELVARLRPRLGRDIPLEAVFDAPTVAELADHLGPATPPAHATTAANVTRDG